MDENTEFKKILTPNFDGTSKNMYLIPYAKNLSYKDGHLMMTLEFFNDIAETEVGIDILISDELQQMFDRLLQEEVV